MTEHKTTFVVEGKTRGFPQVQAEAAKLTSAASKAVQQQIKDFENLVKKGQGYTTMWSRLRASAGFPKMSTEAAGYAKQVVDLTKRLERLASQQAATLREMAGVDEASDAYKALAGNLDKVRDRTQKVRDEMRSLREANRQAAAEAERYAKDVAGGRGAFTQGLLQGALPGGLIQRGPGALQQAAGTAIGAGVRGLAYDRPRTILGGMASTPFAGLGGLAQGLSGIPIVGGVLAGQLQTAAGFSGMALQRQSMLRGLAPQLGAGFTPDRGAMDRAAALARVRARTTPGFQDSSVTDARVQALMAGGAEMEPDRPWWKPEGPRSVAMGRNAAETQVAGERVARTAAANTKAARRAAAAARARVAAASPEGAMRAAGRDLAGMSTLESLQFAGAMSAAGGGTFQDLQQQGLMRTAFAAQTRFGVGADVSGQFLRGVRRGGIAGEQGQTAGQVLTRTLSDAVELGLKGSEVQEYLRTVAAGINQFQTTGIPLNPRSLKEMSMDLRAAGLAPTRAQVVAQGVNAAAQGIAQRGVQSPLDIVMMQTLGGSKGGGLGGYVESMRKMESGGFKGPEMAKLFKVLMGSGGGGAAGQIVFHNAMQRMGVPVSWEETGLMQRQAQGTLTDADRKRLEALQREREEGPASEKDLQAQAAKLLKELAPNLKRQAEIQDRQMDVGGQMVTAVQNLNAATTNVNAVFAKEVGPTLTKVTEGVLALTTMIPDLIQTVKDLIRKRPQEY